MDTRTPAEQERLYDLQRSGQLYVKPEPVEQPEQPASLMLALADVIQPAGATPEQEFAAGVRDGAALAAWVIDQTEADEQQAPADVDRDELAGRAGAMMTMLYRKLDDRRADDLVCLLEDLLSAEPSQRESIVDSLLEVE